MKRYLHIALVLLLWGCFVSPVSAQGLNPLLTQQVTGVSALHQNGQTFVTWREINLIIPADAPSGKEFYGLKSSSDEKVTYRVYAARYPITTLNGLYPCASVPSLSGWDQTAYGISTDSSDKTMHRYVISDNGAPLDNGTGLWVHNPDWTGTIYYAVTAVVNGRENKTISPANSLLNPISESVGPGKPILQRIETPQTFMNVSNPQLYFYTRWEAPPNCSIEGKAFDYLVGIPPKPVSPAPVGIHMHCWGGFQESGYTWWNDAEDGAILLASNEDPYDWWTGYHERNLTPYAPKTSADWSTGVVRPYTSNRLFSFLSWMQGESLWSIDPYRTFTAGSSMGGSGSMMTGIRNGGKIAWVRSCVGVHVPGETTTMKSAYAANFGNPESGVLFENGIPVWNYYDDVWFLRQYPAQDTPFLSFSNAKNDPLIDWPQAVHFYQALQDTKRPHLFVWGQDGHSQMAKMPGNGSEQTMPIDIRLNQTLPAFTRCSLDDNPGNGDPADGTPIGQINGYLFWKTEDILDTPEQWELTVGLMDSAPQNTCTVDITPRRVQQFKIPGGYPVRWENRDFVTGAILAAGIVNTDGNGLITLPQITVSKNLNRIIITR